MGRKGMNPDKDLREKKMDGGSGWRKGGTGEPSEAVKNKPTPADCEHSPLIPETTNWP